LLGFAGGAVTSARLQQLEESPIAYAAYRRAARRDMETSTANYLNIDARKNLLQSWCGLLAAVSAFVLL